MSQEIPKGLLGISLLMGFTSEQCFPSVMCPGHGKMQGLMQGGLGARDPAFLTSSPMLLLWDHTHLEVSSCPSTPDLPHQRPVGEALGLLHVQV